MEEAQRKYCTPFASGMSKSQLNELAKDVTNSSGKELCLQRGSFFIFPISIAELEHGHKLSESITLELQMLPGALELKNPELLLFKLARWPLIIP